jgi:hypothetical protein
VLLEGVARPLVIAHALLGATLVGLTTHHLIWIIRSRGARRRGEPRFALLASGAFCLAFLFGSLVYPTYRVRVRAEYFDSPSAQRAEHALRSAQHLAPGPAPALPSLERVAHVFDIKEHLVGLGLFASLGLLWLSRRTDPSAEPERLLYLGLGWFVCLASWSALIIGLYTTSLRAVGDA